MKFAMIRIMSAALFSFAVSAQQAAPAQSEPAFTASSQGDKAARWRMQILTLPQAP